MTVSDIDGILSYELRGDVAIVGLNRPEKRNAISDRVVLAIEKAIIKAEAEARSAVLFGHGKHFCAGLDLAEHSERTPIEGVENSRMWHRIFSLMHRGTIPWFSALHGAVVGGGLELASSTHVRVADRSTFFGLPEGQRGIYVGGGASVRSAGLMGVARMTDMMLTGRTVDADTAETWNLVQYVVDEGQAVDKAIELATKAATNAPMSNYSVINALPRIQDMSYEDGLFTESFVASMAASSPEALERLEAFLSKKVAKVAAPTDA